MDSTTLSSKGQIVIPKTLRDAQRWKPGTVFSIKSVDGALMLVPLPAACASHVADVAGCLKAPSTISAGRRRIDESQALRRRALLDDEASKT